MPELVWLAGFEGDVADVYERLEEWRADAGDAFFTALSADLAILRAHPFAGPGVRRTPVRSLRVVQRRYSVLYVVENRGVLLHALLDNLADPETMERRLREILRRLGWPPRPE